MSTKILIIEDMPEMSQLISLYVNKADMESIIASSAEEAEEILKTEEPALIVLDLNLPGKSGFEFLNELRNTWKKNTPVIIVSARDSDEDIIKTLDDGADDFVTKPFSPKVLIARIQSRIARQSAATAAAEESYSFGPYTLLMNSCVLKRGPEKIPLSTKEYNILEFLVKNEGKTLTPEEIFYGVWKLRYGDFTAVAVYIQRLRKKLEPVPADPRYFKTVFGKGYMFSKCS